MHRRKLTHHTIINSIGQDEANISMCTSTDQEGFRLIAATLPDATFFGQRSRAKFDVSSELEQDPQKLMATRIKSAAQRAMFIDPGSLQCLS